MSETRQTFAGLAQWEKGLWYTLVIVSTARPSEQRIEEALGVPGVNLFVVTCPKDVTMNEDAVKSSGAEGRIHVSELSELVLESVGLPPLAAPLQTAGANVAGGAGERA